jgi:DNA-binding IclR family transcriptional regulator
MNEAMSSAKSNNLWAYWSLPSPIESKSNEGYDACELSNILAKTVEVLDLISSGHRGLTVTDVAVAMNTSKSTASRLLAAMVEARLLERDDAQRHFLDFRFWSWGAQSVRRLTVVDIARPHVAAAVKKLGVSVYIAVARETETIYLENITLLSGYPFMNLISYVVPIYACAPGKAILAHSHGELIESVLNGPLEKFTPNTLATRFELEEELQRIRRLGYAANRGEYADNGRVAIAVPLFDHTGLPAAAVCFHDIVDEDKASALVPELIDLGKTISSSLGYARAVHQVVG